MIGTIKAASHIISNLHPERLHKCFIFPIPQYAVSSYKFLKPLLDKSITDSIVLVPGPASGLHAPVPKEELAQYLDEASIDMLEARRLDLFHPKNKEP